ncbi:MAG: hypothetical protein PHI84_02015 [Kiritimatiellae bacterium]|nr:hypothetical protein [Kiritimatiellia bacterium]
MGRYYSGDVEGKFWFGVQPTSDLLEFGYDRSDCNLNVIVPYDNLREIGRKLKALKKAFLKHGATFESFMKVLNSGGSTARKKREKNPTRWQTMCRDASLIELGEKILTALRQKKDDLFIEGEC